MKATVNGKEVELNPPTLPSVFAELGLSELRGVAVAVDQEIVPKAHWDSIELKEGAQVEILHAVQGG